MRQGETEFTDLSGRWHVRLADGSEYEAVLPGTLDQNRIGYPDRMDHPIHPDEDSGMNVRDEENADTIATRFTRKYTYEGAAVFSRMIVYREKPGRRLFLEAERARCLRLYADGTEIPPFSPGTLSTPHVFELTGKLNGEHRLEIVSDNSYPGLPHDNIVYSSTATDETQTNWNGITGYFRLREEPEIFLSALRVYPLEESTMLRVEAEVSAPCPWTGTIACESTAIAGRRVSRPVRGQAGTVCLVFERIPVEQGADLWDEDGILQELCASLDFEAEPGSGNCHTGAGTSERAVSFGLRTFGDNGTGRLALNGRTVFLRSEANCAEFPETGCPPTDSASWEEILRRYRAYGINCMRFHSHCPPEAAFEAADRLGMLMQPELSHWNPKNAFETDESFAYYRTEMREILRTLANHPSFVMLTWGNELACGETGHERMRELLREAKETDPTRLYAEGSNAHYGMAGAEKDADFYASQNWYSMPLRGTAAGGRDGSGLQGYINNAYPGSRTDYSDTMKALRETFKKPVFSFEVGQFEVLPDFGELADFHGISDPANYRLIQRKAERLGLTDVWPEYVQATGELSRLAYREEIEAAMRTEALSGISLLGLQDFPGQGTALVGMMNAHLDPKPWPFARPEAFARFFRDCQVLIGLSGYTWENTETLSAALTVANYGKERLEGEVEAWLLAEEGDDLKGLPESLKEEAFLRFAGLEGNPQEDGGIRCVWKYRSQKRFVCEAGKHTKAGVLSAELSDIRRASRMELVVRIGEVVNGCPLWVYPAENPKKPDCVFETEAMDEAAGRVLEEGGIVYLSPKASANAMPRSVKTQFTTDFWSVGTFPGQPGGMGQLIDVSHPLFKDFPTEFHTNWQWWPMAGSRAVILPDSVICGRNERAAEYSPGRGKEAPEGKPEKPGKPFKAIITEMDSYAYMRPMAQLFECRCGKGRVLFSSMGLQDLRQYPEARALLGSIYRYLASDAFAPEAELTPEELESLAPCRQEV